jgi:hypothetical protein
MGRASNVNSSTGQAHVEKFTKYLVLVIERSFLLKTQYMHMEPKDNKELHIIRNNGTSRSPKHSNILANSTARASGVNPTGGENPEA